MVEKIDRPEAPTPYRITETKQTKEDQHQGQQPRDEAQAKYQKLLEETKEWGKFHRRELTVKPVRVPRGRIDRCLFRNVVLRSGAAILVVDLAWTNGQTTAGALILLKQLEDYFKLKHFRPGQEVPEEFWLRGEEVEVGIPQEMGSGPFPAPAFEEQRGGAAPVTVTESVARWKGWGIFNSVTGRPRWSIIIALIFAVAVIIIAALQGGR